MVSYLRAHPECRILLVEKTDRLYRNFKDYVTIDDLDLQIHFVALRRNSTGPAF